MDTYKEKLRNQQDDSDRKLEAARTLEFELRDRIRDLEEGGDNKAKSRFYFIVISYFCNFCFV